MKIKRPKRKRIDIYKNRLMIGEVLSYNHIDKTMTVKNISKDGQGDVVHVIGNGNLVIDEDTERKSPIGEMVVLRKSEEGNDLKNKTVLCDSIEPVEKGLGFIEGFISVKYFGSLQRIHVTDFKAIDFDDEKEIIEYTRKLDDLIIASKTALKPNQIDNHVLYGFSFRAMIEDGDGYKVIDATDRFLGQSENGLKKDNIGLVNDMFEKNVFEKDVSNKHTLLISGNRTLKEMMRYKSFIERRYPEIERDKIKFELIPSKIFENIKSHRSKLKTYKRFNSRTKESILLRDMRVTEVELNAGEGDFFSGQMGARGVVFTKKNGETEVDGRKVEIEYASAFDVVVNEKAIPKPIFLLVKSSDGKNVRPGKDVEIRVYRERFSDLKLSGKRIIKARSENKNNDENKIYKEFYLGR